MEDVPKEVEEAVGGDAVVTASCWWRLRLALSVTAGLLHNRDCIGHFNTSPSTHICHKDNHQPIFCKELKADSSS
ncbi:hypothetical protein E2C01_092098 [Portunus trituberculatus]|uniref:Uncharacterized protein n=1 Tax=Portunus trituberculatus TaxID=210409 RepID=A0A5B7JPQ1_PORTR|nr:hypothetical protein [Portunus trituberculatus]